MRCHYWSASSARPRAACVFGREIDRAEWKHMPLRWHFTAAWERKLGQFRSKRHSCSHLCSDWSSWRGLKSTWRRVRNESQTRRWSPAARSRAPCRRGPTPRLLMASAALPPRRRRRRRHSPLASSPVSPLRPPSWGVVRPSTWRQQHTGSAATTGTWISVTVGRKERRNEGFETPRTLDVYILGPNWALKTIETLSKATQIRDRQEKMSVGKKLGPM